MKSSLLFPLVFIFLNVQLVYGALKFHTMGCTSYAESIVHFDECRIKAIDRAHNSINVRAAIKKTLSSIQVNVKFLKRESGGWHPFLYKFTVDVCSFFRCRARYPLPNIVFFYVRNYTNFNSSCPLWGNSSLDILNWRIDEGMFLSQFPIELGIYGMNTMWYSQKTKLFTINGSINIS